MSLFKVSAIVNGRWMAEVFKSASAKTAKEDIIARRGKGEDGEVIISDIEVMKI